MLANLFWNKNKFLVLPGLKLTEEKSLSLK